MGNPLAQLMGTQPTHSSSPAMQLLAAMQAGRNPIAALGAINPQLAQQLQNKSPREIEAFVRQEYAKRGVDIDAAMRNIQSLMQMK